MSHLIDLFSSVPSQTLQPDVNTYSTNRTNLSYQNFTNHLKAYTHLSDSIKYFHCRGQKCDILLQVQLFNYLPAVMQKIHIDRKRMIYQSKFLFRNGGEILSCQTKCLRIMIIRELELLRKRMRSFSFCLAVDQQSGEMIGKHIFSISPQTNIYQILMCQLIPLRSHFTRILTILLLRSNTLPPIYNQFLHERTKTPSFSFSPPFSPSSSNSSPTSNQLTTEQKIQRRIYKYYYFSIIELWKSLGSSPAEELENPVDKDLMKRLEMEVWAGFVEDSAEMYMYRQKGKFQMPYCFDVSEEETVNIRIHLNVPRMEGKRSQSNFIFNQIKVLQESSESIDTGYRGATTKIKLAKLRFIYTNALTNPSQNHNSRALASKQYTKAVGIKVPLDSVNPKSAKKKSQHQISILKLFNDVESPFLLRYFVSNSPTFKYNGMLMMNFMSNCDTMASFLEKKKEVLSFSSKIYVLINVLQALKLIKEYQVVHMDLSPGNVLISANYISRLIDFGESYHQKKCGKDYNPGYTLPFSFPQKFTSKHFTSKSDMFSFGVLAFYSIFKSLPYNPSQKLVDSLRKFTYINKFFFSPESVDYYGYSKIIIFLLAFIQKCMDPDPVIRPHPSWAIILFKELYYWMFQLSMMM